MLTPDEDLQNLASDVLQSLRSDLLYSVLPPQPEKKERPKRKRKTDTKFLVLPAHKCQLLDDPLANACMYGGLEEARAPDCISALLPLIFACRCSDFCRPLTVLEFSHAQASVGAKDRQTFPVSSLSLWNSTQVLIPGWWLLVCAGATRGKTHNSYMPAFTRIAPYIEQYGPRKYSVRPSMAALAKNCIVL